MVVESSRETGGPGYQLSSVASDADVAPGTNILVGGPSMSGKREAGLRMLAEGSARGQGSIVVTTNRGADRIVEEYAQVGGTTDDSALGVVDCMGHQRDETDSQEDHHIEHVRSPRDLAGIGTSVSELLEAFGDDRGLEHNRVMLDSVSTLLVYFDVQTIFRFLHMFTRRIDAADAIGVFLIDSSAHDSQTMNTLLQLFDSTLTVESAGPGDQPTTQFRPVR